MQLLCSNVRNLEKWMSGASLGSERIENIHGVCINNNAQAVKKSFERQSKKKYFKSILPFYNTEIYS
jgi:hypothetical protein